jgi:superfamily II DNA/RNA helicase
MAQNQATDYRNVLTAFRRARTAKQQGDQKTLTASLKRLSPGSFEGQEPDEETVARLGSALGTLRDTALNRVVNLHKEGCKLDWICGNESAGTGGYVNDHKGEPTVIFAHNLDAVAALHARLKEQGHRVAVIRGGMSAGAKDRAKNAFSPAAGEPTADVLICSDAAAMGANLQRGYHLINYDTPMTAMLHEQRIAREVRQGQKNAVSVHDLIADAPIERRARKRLEQKGQLREINSAPLETLDDTGLLLRMRERLVRHLDHTIRKAA